MRWGAAAATTGALAVGVPSACARCSAQHGRACAARPHQAAPPAALRRLSLRPAPSMAADPAEQAWLDELAAESLAEESPEMRAFTALHELVNALFRRAARGGLRQDLLLRRQERAQQLMDQEEE